MFEKIIRFSVYRRSVIFLATLALAVWGVRSFQQLPIDAVPDITNNQVQVNTSTHGLTPEEIERYVTVPIENGMGGLSGLLETRSVSRFGLSQVTLVFEDGLDVYRVRQLVSERLQEVLPRLPKGYQPKLGPVTTGLGEVLHYAVRASTPAAGGEERVRQWMELHSLQDWVIVPRLLTVPGVAEISTIGGDEKQFHVQPDVRRMVRYGIHFEDLVQALEKTNENVGGGYIQQGAEQLLVQATALLRTPEDIRAVPLRTLETLRTLTVGDIANVRLATPLRMGAALVDGREEVIGTVLMRLGENSRVVAHAAAAKLEEVQKQLPEGVVITRLYDRADLVDATLKTVEHNLLMGALLVTLILVLLLGNVRAALITAFTIPVTLLITFILMKRWGVSGNLMSLGALDFGIIIDGVVIMVDHCVRKLNARGTELRQALSPLEVKETVVHAAMEIRRSAGFGELIIAVVFIPIFALTGIEGKMFGPMAATFTLAVLTALVLSFTLAPALAGWVFRGAVRDREPWLMRQAHRFYTRLLEKALTQKKAVLGLASAAVLIAGALFFRLGGEFLPQLDEGSILLQCIRPNTVSIDRSIALQAESDRVIGEFPQVSHVFSRLGTSEAAVDVMGINVSDTFVMLKDRSSWPPIDGRKPSKEELAQAIAKRLSETVPDQEILISQPIQMRFNEILEGTRADIAVKVFGDDLDQISAVAGKIQEILEKVRGVGEVESDLQGKVPLLQIEPKADRLRGLGISNREVLETVGIALGGQEAGSVYEGFKRYPIMVRLAEKDRQDLDRLRELPVGIASNATMPLREAAELRFQEAYGTITREQGKRRAALLISTQGRDTESFVKEARRAVAQSVDVPPGMFVEWGGNFRNLQTAKMRLLLLTPVVLALVLLIIYAAFRNIPQTLLVFSGVPLALVGGVLGLIANGLPFSITAGVGFVALTGISVLNGVVLVNVFNDLRRSGLEGRALILEGTSLRLRPVLMTALVEIFGFLPMMLSTGVGAEVQRPLASVVIGGVVSSTLLTLVVLPVLVEMFEKRVWKGAARKG
jgi:heavy metal efflux system protein